LRAGLAVAVIKLSLQRARAALGPRGPPPLIMLRRSKSSEAEDNVGCVQADSSRWRIKSSPWSPSGGIEAR